MAQDRACQVKCPGRTWVPKNEQGLVPQESRSPQGGTGVCAGAPSWPLREVGARWGGGGGI